jgi:hypothetical protein
MANAILAVAVHGSVMVLAEAFEKRNPKSGLTRTKSAFTYI